MESFLAEIMRSLIAIHGIIHTDNGRKIWLWRMLRFFVAVVESIVVAKLDM